MQYHFIIVVAHVVDPINGILNALYLWWTSRIRVQTVWMSVKSWIRKVKVYKCIYEISGNFFSLIVQKEKKKKYIFDPGRLMQVPSQLFDLGPKTIFQNPRYVKSSNWSVSILYSAHFQKPRIPNWKGRKPYVT